LSYERLLHSDALTAEVYQPRSSDADLRFCSRRILDGLTCAAQRPPPGDQPDMGLFGPDSDAEGWDLSRHFWAIVDGGEEPEQDRMATSRSVMPREVAVAGSGGKSLQP